jgi:hypothetical protein
MKKYLFSSFVVMTLIVISATLLSFSINKPQKSKLPEHICRLYYTEYKCVNGQVTVTVYNAIGGVISSHPGGGCAFGPWSCVVMLAENNPGQVVDETLTAAIKSGLNLNVNATAPTMSNPQPIIKYIRGSDLTTAQYSFFKKYDL